MFLKCTCNLLPEKLVFAVVIQIYVCTGIIKYMNINMYLSRKVFWGMLLMVVRSTNKYD